MSFRTVAAFGKRQEYRVIAKLLDLGFDVYQTLVDDQAIDCIVRINPKKYLDIQIKASSTRSQKVNAGIFVAKDFKPRDNYFFVFYVEYLDKFWVIPSKLFHKTAGRNVKGKHIGDLTINLTGVKKGEIYPREQYQEYIDNFGLLRKYSRKTLSRSRFDRLTAS